MKIYSSRRKVFVESGHLVEKTLVVLAVNGPAAAAHFAAIQEQAQINYRRR